MTAALARVDHEQHEPLGLLGPSPQPVDDEVVAEARAIGTAIDTCLRAYPGATRARVEQLLWAFYERTSDAKVQQYRVLLAERDTRARLRLDERAHMADHRSVEPAVQQDLVVLDGSVDDLAEDVHETSTTVWDGLQEGLADCTR